MHVVLLDADFDLRTHPFAHESPATLLPVLDAPLLGTIVAWLRGAGAGEISLVTSRNPAEDLEMSRAVVAYELRVVGSLGEALERVRRELRMDELLVVMDANLHVLTDFSELITKHMIGRNALTYVRGASMHGPGRYTFGPPVLAMASPVVSRMMRFDDRPRPLPHMLRAVRERGLGTAAYEPDTRVLSIDNSYALYHANLDGLTPEFLDRAAASMGLVQRAPRLWVAEGARMGKVTVDPTGGPVVVGRGAVVEDGAILRGPTIVGRGSAVEKGSCLHRSLVLIDSQIPRESWVARSIVSRRLRERVAA